MTSSVETTVCWVGTSWKMNKTLAEAIAYADALTELLPSVDARIQPFLVPPFTVARQVKAKLAPTRVKVGAQNMHWADNGAWTGEISPPMLLDCGLDFVEIGHSERRAHFGETNETVGLKTAAALRHELTPLICIGETLADRDAGRSDSVLAQQVAAALGGMESPQPAAPVLLAYEPVWAIGESGVPASADYADERHRRIKEVAADILGRTVPVLYGGSVDADNAANLVARPHIDGLFIGRAAWHPEGYAAILRNAALALDEGANPVLIA